jgi:hypothetical protein
MRPFSRFGFTNFNRKRVELATYGGGKSSWKRVLESNPGEPLGRMPTLNSGICRSSGGRCHAACIGRIPVEMGDFPTPLIVIKEGSPLEMALWLEG